MKTAANTAEFVADLNSERDGTAEFISLLAMEQDALRAGAVEHLEALARDKAEMAQQLGELAQRRARYLAASGLSPDARGMESWLSAHPQDAGAAAAWHGLRRFAEQARLLNQVNGALINLQLRHHQQMLAALQNACGGPVLYGPQGQTLPMPSTRQVSAA